MSEGQAKPTPMHLQTQRQKTLSRSSAPLTMAGNGASIYRVTDYTNIDKVSKQAHATVSTNQGWIGNEASNYPQYRCTG